MPAKSRPSPEPDPSVAAGSSAPSASSASSTSDEASSPDEDGVADSAPANRAERRAKGKTTAKAQPTFRGKAVGSHGPASTQRMWSNRRSGG